LVRQAARPINTLQRLQSVMCARTALGAVTLRSSDIRVIITTYRTEKICDDHPYIWRYTARRALVIFDHPYNAEYAPIG